MTRFNDLRAILSAADSLAALEVYYERAWDRVLRELALGIARPGGQRARLLVAKLRGILATLDPRRDSFVRHWVREWIRASFLVGEQAAMVEIEPSQKPLRVPSRATVDVVANAIGALDQKLVAVVTQADAALVYAIHAVQAAILLDPDLRGGLSDGILRTAKGRTVAGGLQQVLLGGLNPVTAALLAKNGISKAVVDALDRVNRGVIAIGKAAVNVVSYVKMAAQDTLVDANVAAARLATHQNQVDHVYVERCVKRNICAFCLGVQFNVFYDGPLEKDPAGFPRLRDLPTGPPWHHFCGHGLLPWPLAQHDRAEIAAALAKALSIPAAFFGPAGTVEKINHGAGDVSKLRKLA